MGSGDEMKELAQKGKPAPKDGDKKKKLAGKKDAKKPAKKAPKGLAQKNKHADKPNEKGDWEGEFADHLRKFDKDGSGDLDEKEGRKVFEDAGFQGDVIDMMITEIGNELKRAPKIEEVVGFVDDMVHWAAHEHGVSEDEAVAWAMDNVDPADITKD